MLRITTIRGVVFHIAVVPDDIRHCYHVRLQNEVPWCEWSGDAVDPDYPGYTIYRGDRPDTYIVQKAQACCV